MRKLVCLLTVFSAIVCLDFNAPLAAAAGVPQTQDETGKDKKPAKKDYRTAKFSVSLTCENCVNKVSENLSFEKGVKGLDIKLEDKTVAVIYDAAKTDEKTLGEAIRKLGYEVELLAPEGKPGDKGPEQK